MRTRLIWLSALLSVCVIGCSGNCGDPRGDATTEGVDRNGDAGACRTGALGCPCFGSNRITRCLSGLVCDGELCISADDACGSRVRQTCVPDPDPGACEIILSCDDAGACDGRTNTCVECLDDDDCDGRCWRSGFGEDPPQCVECLDDDDCDGRCKRVSLGEGAAACVECLEDADCPTPGNTCDLGLNVCAACVSNASCTGRATSRCDAGSCTGCIGHSDCAHLPQTPACAGGRCVECTRSERSACGNDAAGEPLVCESHLQTCSDTATARSTDLCGECVADAQCMLGQLCIYQWFGGPLVGSFCMWQRGVGEGGAPALCSEVRPYFKTWDLASTIALAKANVCTLAVSTCPAHNDFNSPDVDCAPGGVADDTLCGAPGLDDGYCRQPDAQNEIGRAHV